MCRPIPRLQLTRSFSPPRTALAQIERLITECEHRIASQREIIADAVEKTTLTVATMAAT
jgi:hypothetical protein